MSEPALTPPKQVPVISPDGQEGTVAETDLNDALRQGYRTPDMPAPPTKEELYGDPLAAGVLGAFSTATLGASDVLLSHDVAGGRAALKGAREESPVATGVGELGGMLVSPVGELGTAVAKGVGATTVAGRIGAKALAGAAENSLFGAGQAVSESALGDTDLTAQKLIAAGGLGSVLGAVGGGLGGVLEEGAGMGAKKLAAMFDDSKDALKGVSNRLTNKAAGFIQSDVKRLVPTPEAQAELSQFLRDNGLVGKDVRETLDKVRTLKEGLSKEYDAFYDASKKAGAEFEPKAFIDRTDEWLSKLDPAEKEAIAPVVAKYQQHVLELERAGSLDFESVSGLKTSLNRDINYAAEGGLKSGLKKQLTHELKDEIDRQVEAQLSDVARDKFQKLRSDWRLSTIAEDGAENGVNRMMNSSVPLRSWFAGGIGGHLGSTIGGAVAGPAGAAVGGALGSLTGAIGAKFLKERGPALAAKLADRIAESPVLQTVAEHFTQAIQRAPQGMLGDFAPVLMEAAASGPERALATHMVLASRFPQYQDAAALAGFPGHSGDEQEAALKKAHALTVVKATTQAHDKDADRAIDKAVKGGNPQRADVFGTRDFGAKRMRRDTPQAFQARAAEVEKLAANPRALAEQVGANVGALSAAAPQTAAAVAKTASAAVQLLSAKLPKAPPQGPLSQPFVPSPAEIQSFSRTLEAVQEPMSVLKHVARGTVTPEEVQALQVVYPQLYQHLQARVAARLTEEGPESVPYRQRVMLSLFLGTDVDGTMGQGIIQRNQLALAQPQPQEGPAPAPKPKEGALSRMGFAKRRSASISEAEEA